MALPLASGSSSGLRLLRMHPALRLNRQHTSPISRSFSSTASRKWSFDPVGLAIYLPIQLLDGVHMLGAPWCATIPITALCVRWAVGYYMIAVPDRKKRVFFTHISSLTSLVEVHNSRHDYNYSRIARLLWRWKHIKSVARRLGVPLLSWRMFANNAMLLLFIEAIRAKCGAEGLLSLLFAPAKWAWNWLFAPASTRSDHAIPSAPPSPLNPPEALAEKIWKAQQDASTNGSSAESLTINSSAAPDTSAIRQCYVDPSLTHEGFSWCQDLTAIDSTSVLPLSLAATILLFSLWPKPYLKITAERTSKISDPLAFPGAASQQTMNNVRAALESLEQAELDASRARSRAGGRFGKLDEYQRIRVLLALMFSLIATQLPAAIVLYLLPSMLIGQLQSRWLIMKYPVADPIKLRGHWLRYPDGSLRRIPQARRKQNSEQNSDAS